jgi:hypothetical protein
MDSDRLDDWPDISRGEQVMDALEVMRWHESSVPPERSDESFIKRRRFEIVEKRPAPLDLTADDQLEFLSEYCAGFQHVAATKEKAEFYMVFSEWFETTRAKTLSEAICTAAAIWKGVNE